MKLRLMTLRSQIIGVSDEVTTMVGAQVQDIVPEVNNDIELFILYISMLHDP